MSRKAPPTNARRYALCVDAGEYENVDLLRRKVYQVWLDPDAESHGQIRVVDQSGQDYLFPAESFQIIALPAGADRAVRDARSRPGRAASKTRR